MKVHDANLGMFAELIDRLIIEPEYPCATCNEYFPRSQIKSLCRMERGEWVNVNVCREHEKEWIDQGGWRR
jgi:hypothetical protein